MERDDFKNIIKKDPQVQKRDMLSKCNRLPCFHQSKKGYDTLIPKVILKEIINLMGTTIVNIDRELKIKIGRVENLVKKNSYISKYTLV